MPFAGSWGELADGMAHIPRVGVRLVSELLNCRYSRDGPRQLTCHACLIGARHGPIAGIEVIATVDVSNGPLRSVSCELHCVLLAECSSG
jgi:hypothetical protein